MRFSQEEPLQGSDTVPHCHLAALAPLTHKHGRRAGEGRAAEGGGPDANGAPGGSRLPGASRPPFEGEAAVSFGGSAFQARGRVAVH